MDISNNIKQYITKNILFDAQGFPYDEDASFLAEGIIDSLGIMELVAFVEKEYGIRVAEEELLPENFDSVNKLSRYIKSKIDSVQAVAEEPAIPVLQTVAA